MRRLLPLLAAVLLLAGCGGDDEKTSTKSAATAAPSGTYQAGGVTTDLKSEPGIPAPSGNPPSDLVVKDIVKGKGKPLKEGETASVQYVGVSFSTGLKFDATWDRGAEPLEFPVQKGSVIDGWVQGVPGMRVGGRRELIIPPALGYGANGQGDIAPNETLIFVIDLVKIKA